MLQKIYQISLNRGIKEHTRIASYRQRTISFFMHVVWQRSLSWRYIVRRRASFAIPLAAKTLIGLMYFADRNSREDGTSNFLPPALEIRIRANRKSRMEHIARENRDNLTPTGRRHGPSTSYSLDYVSLWCAVTERDTNLSTIVIEWYHVPIATCTERNLCVEILSFNEPENFLGFSSAWMRFLRVRFAFPSRWYRMFSEGSTWRYLFVVSLIIN